MLSDHNCELLTAYVDGELDARERQVADRLISSSPEARDFLDKLQSDSKELHNLPPKKAPETLADSVMVTLSDHDPLPARPPNQVPPAVVAPSPHGIPIWLGLAMVACVLVAVSVGTYFLAGGLLGNKPDDKMAKPASVLDPFLAALFGDAAAKFGEEVKDAHAGMRLVLTEMQEEPVKKRLANELKKETGVWFDVPTVKNDIAVKQLTNAFNESGFRVLIDPSAKNIQAAPKQENVQFVLYAENVSPDDVSQILKKMSETAMSKPAASGLQNQVLMTAITVEKRTLLAKAMGVKPDRIDPAAKPELKLLTPMEAPKAAGEKNTEQPKAQRFVMLLALKNGGGPQSPELQKFFASRAELRPGTVQMVILFHENQAG